MSRVDEDVAQAVQAVSHGAPRGGVGVAELTHGAFRNQFSDYLDGSLDPANRERIDRHLSACRSCQAFLDTLRATVRLARDLPARAAPSGAKASILRRAAADQ